MCPFGVFIAIDEGFLFLNEFKFCIFKKVTKIEGLISRTKIIQLFVVVC